MTMPGMTAQGSLYCSNLAYRAMPVSVPISTDKPVSLSADGVRYACHLVCYGENFCEVVCGPILSPDADPTR
jgi:hypothetical protein